MWSQENPVSPPTGTSIQQLSLCLVSTGPQQGLEKRLWEDRVLHTLEVGPVLLSALRRFPPELPDLPSFTNASFL